MEPLIDLQNDLYGRIARAFENLRKSGAARITRGVVEARLQNLEANWAKFDAQHAELIADYKKELATHDYKRGGLHQVAEEAYLTQKSLFLDTLHDLQEPPLEEILPAIPSRPRTTLPRIQLPQFTGRYEDWPPFRDLFHSLIERDAAITPVEKLHYLKTCVKGDADQLIRNLPTTAENFERAWQALTDFYENKKLLVRAYISRFTALTKMKSESASELRKLYHGVLNTVSSLEGIARPITRGEDLFVYLAVELLDSRSRREWENATSETMEPPSYAELRIFLERRLHALESLQPGKSEAAKSEGTSSKSTRAFHASKQDNKGGRCSLCGKVHYILWCDMYQKKTADERKRHIEANNLCLNCLGRHKTSDCRSKKACSTCSAQHHTSLHEAFQTSEVTTTSHLAQHPPALPVAVLLATARVRVLDRCGAVHMARALVDQGSESSLVSESLAQRLRLSRSSTSIAIFGVGGKQTGTARGLIAMQISPLTGGSPMTVPALVFPQLTLYDSGVKADPKSWTHLAGLELADPDYLAADPIDILLGADVYAYILQLGLRKGGSNEPVAQQTSLGWILSGAVSSANASRRALTLHCRVEEDLATLVQKFWQQDELADRSSVLTPADQECEDRFRQTHSRAADGRYIVRLPVKAPLPDLSCTRHTARRVLASMERRFSQDALLRQLYVDFLRQYEDMGHMTLLNGSEIEGPASYLPHHGVLRESSTTTKLRVVFNGSTATSSGASLNRHLLVGANLLPPLADVLLRWRVHRFVLATDIEKMYRQVLVHPEDRDLQRIIWRYNPHDEFHEYRLNTVTYGLACAPFLAMRVLRQLADDEESRYPLGAAVIRKDVYMDDVLTGADSLTDARELRHQLVNLCLAGGFPLRKWSANDMRLMDDVPSEHRMNSELRDWRPHETHSTLGLRWHPSQDHFSFSTKAMSIAVVTKRSVLSLTARLFDPLGWLAPVVVSAKIAFQATWRRGLGWDEPLDEASTRSWLNYQAELHRLEEIQIPRWIGPVSTGNVEIHGFCDASELAYAAVTYLRTEHSGSWSTRLIAAKTKVAPIKQISLPRLELCAATLLARLVAHVRSTLDLTGASVHLWSDSTVALGWIRDHPSRWHTFVANRVAEIQTTVASAWWHHVPGRENPADCASRGLSPGDLVGFQLWWRGPPWLDSDVSEWPTAVGSSPKVDLPEERVRVHAAETAVATREAEELLRFSSLHRLLRVTAWCRRWLLRRGASVGSANRASRRPFETTLSVCELEEARRVWIRAVQTAHYAAEIKSVERNQPLSKANKLVRLSPFLDAQGILRVGGRLGHAVLSYDERHPVILPDNSHFTRLIVAACHRRALHGGVQLTLSLVRQQYWVPRGRAVVKQEIHRCVTCVRWRADSPQQRMADLPRERVTRARAFLQTGVDYAGPIQLRASKGRGQRAFKGFVAVFICLSTRAVHLEVASDYSADAFLAALRRFISRRGMCCTLFSDCGTNFVGADSQLRAMFSASSPELQQIMARTATEGISWRFNPPSAPHFGGIWEAAVRSFKHHLKRVLGDHKLTFEEMSTLLAQVEACLNSRPLQALSDDPEDLNALTPGHFLVGSALTAIPEPSLQDVPMNRLTRWQLLQQMRDHFWDRWAKEYLHSLLYRPKWHSKKEDLRVGQLCLVRGDNTPPTRWPLARVVKLHPGQDGLVRVVTVRTATSELVRPIVKLILLPVCDD